MLKRMHAKDIAIELKPAVYQYLADKGYDPQFGARPLNRLIQNTILNRVANMVIGGDVKPGDTIVIDMKKDELTYDIRSRRARPGLSLKNLMSV